MPSMTSFAPCIAGGPGGGRRNPQPLRRWWRSGSRGALQELMHEGDGHAALADGGGDAFDGARAHVAAGEDAGDAGLEEVGVAVLVPVAALDHGLAGEDVAASVA